MMRIYQGQNGNLKALAATAPLLTALTLPEKPVVCAVGAGGKTTLLRALQREWNARGCSIFTTTTHITREPDAVEIEDLAAVERALALHNGITLGRVYDADKLQAVAPAFLEACKPLVTALFVEADGADNRPLKAPADYEPVWPAGCNHVLGVAGLQALGKPIAAGCHRAARVCEVLGKELDEPITEADMAMLLFSTAGSRKGIPAGAGYTAVISQAEGEKRLAAATRIVERLEAQHVNTLVVAQSEGMK